MNKIILILFLLLLQACGQADPRKSEIVIQDPLLTKDVELGIFVMKKATNGEVDFSMANVCDADSCIYIDIEYTKGNGGLTTTYIYWNGDLEFRIKMNPHNDIELMQRGVIHELGHTIFLQHVKHDGEFMNLRPGNCFGPEMRKEYKEIWGSESNEVCI